jgi:hypothetical protein
MFVAPLVVLAVGTYLVLSADQSSGAPKIAPGVTGGAFHPVAGGFVPDDTALAECGGDYACLQQAFGNIAFRRGARPALELFETQMQSNESVRADCHRIVHTIGSAAFARYDENVARSFSVGSPTCASGYYHGILERAFVGLDTSGELIEVARSLCAESGIRRRGFLDYQCQHGLGHGLMIQTGYDLPLALATCARLPTGWDDVACSGGVFMENATTRFGFRSSWLSEEDPLAPCERIPRGNRRSCYLRAAVRILELNGNDFASAARTCLGLARPWARACLRGYGREVVGAARYAPGKILSLCRLSGASAGDCLYGAARTVGDGTGSDGVLRAAKLCRSAPPNERGACFSGLGVVVGLLYPTHATRRRACAEISGSELRSCTQAAIAEVDPSGRGAWG